MTTDKAIARFGLAWALLSAALLSNAATVRGIVFDHVGATQPFAKVELRARELPVQIMKVVFSVAYRREDAESAEKS